MIAAFMADPWIHAVAIIFGAGLGFGELFLRGKRVPAPYHHPVKRGAPGRQILISFGCCLIFATGSAIFLFGADTEKEYFIAAGAAVQTLANVLR